MTQWGRLATRVGGRRSIIALGVLYVVAAIGLAAVEVRGGTAVSNALILAAFVGSPGGILLYGGYRLPWTNIEPRFYPTITRWCLGAITILTSLLTIYHLLPAASITNPVRAILVITAFVLVPAFAGGMNGARAKSRAFELERAHDLLARTERIADVGGWEIDPDTMEVFWTEHVFDLLELPAGEEPPLDEALEMYHEEDRERVVRAVEDALTDGEPFDAEARIRAATGEVRWLRLQGVPEIVNGTVVTLRGAAQDVTERKEHERALEQANERLKASNERLEQFAYAASHDLQEPLRMISSYLQLIERRYGDVLDAEGREFFEFAIDGADRMRAMVNGLLRYSRVESQGEPFEPVDLNEIVADACDDLAVQLSESDAEVDAEELPVVEGDASQLRQVFQNLVQNAIQYSGDETPRVAISAKRNGSRWTVSVRDEGIGIDPSEQERVFELFQRLQTRNGHGGSGLGLALCERIVERHGGKIWVDSAPGEGATFSFTLPAEQDHYE